MLFKSTRSTKDNGVSAAVAIKTGLAPDGGLYMPESIPALTSEDFSRLSDMDYPSRAAYILGLYLTDYTGEELLNDCRAAYDESKFIGGAAPLFALDNGISALELWHGPTAAFKDMALQIMPHLLSRALKKTGEDRTALILVATSGDTGKAALEGYKDIPQTKIKVFYPVDGVSRVQKLQMMTQEGQNVDVTAIRGNFDDAQTGVKRIFADSAIAEKLNEKNVFLSSANSINWGRLVPQIVYYVSAYCDMKKNGELKDGEVLDVCVPTGNFGNIFAAYLAKKMGVPLGKLICASNKNNILTEFLRTGVYDRNRPFYATISPSMDILISSNLERLLYLVAGPEKTAQYMKALSENGRYQISAEEYKSISENFIGYFADEEDTRTTIRTVFNDRKYLLDPHTAVGYSACVSYKTESGSERKILLASTANPYKFAPDVYDALTGKKPEDELTAGEVLSEYSNTPIHYALKGIASRKVNFTAVCNAEEMPETVFAFADKN